MKSKSQVNNMSDEVVLENRIDLETGMRVLHVMSPSAIEIKFDDFTTKTQRVTKESIDEIRLHHLEARWLMRGELVEFVSGEWRRRVSLYFLRPGERVRDAIMEAAVAYALAEGKDPDYAWVRELPKEIIDGTAIYLTTSRLAHASGTAPMRPDAAGLEGTKEILLLQAEWMPARAVAVGKGNSR
jgi:hypothetical protein